MASSASRRLQFACVVLGALVLDRVWAGQADGASTAPELAASWLDPSWDFRMKFTVVGAKIVGTGTFNDFPLLLRLDSDHAQVFDKAKLDASDIVITSADGVTPLSRQVVTWKREARDAEIWFRADALSKTSREFYLYYGNADTSLAAHDGTVWSPEYLGVYHFAEDPGAGVLRDHGPHANNASAGINAAFTSADTIAGAAGQGWRFNGTTHWIDGDAVQSSDSSHTISAWFACWNQLRPDDADFAFSVEQGFWHLSVKRNSQQRRPDFAQGGFFTWHPATLDTLLHQFVWAMDGVADTIRFYFDGVEQDILLRSQPPSAPPNFKVYRGLQLKGHIGIAGPLFGNNNRFDLMEGIVDEYRIQTGVRRPNWVATEYNNLSDPASFYVFGAEDNGTPVHLLAFTATREPQRAVLQWRVQAWSEDVRGFHIHRGDDPATAVRLTHALLAGQRDYVWVDNEPPMNATRYWLEEALHDGTSIWHGPALLVEAQPLALFLAPNTPNPFGTRTQIGFSLQSPGTVRLDVYDAAGRLVARLVGATLPAGEHSIAWDGRDDLGVLAPSGVYFTRLQSGDAVVTRKLLLNR